MEQVRVSATIAPPGPVVVERYRLPGRNQDGTRIADDMAYGTGTIVEGQSVYTEAQIRAVRNEMNGTASASEWSLWTDFRLMACGIFARGELNDNIGRMIDKFQRNEGGEYNDPVLTRRVQEHESTVAFCRQMEDKIATRLKVHEGGTECIADEEVRYEWLPHPVFNSNGDTFWGGLTIAINDVGPTR